MLSKLETGDADLYRQQLEDLVRLRTPGAEPRCHSLWSTSSPDMGPPVKSEDSENRDAAHCGTALNRSNYDNNDDNIAENIGAARTASKANIEETLRAVRTVSKANKEETL